MLMAARKTEYSRSRIRNRLALISKQKAICHQAICMSGCNRHHSRAEGFIALFGLINWTKEKGAPRRHKVSLSAPERYSGASILRGYLGHPFTAPSVIPFINCFCRETNSTMIGIADMMGVFGMFEPTFFFRGGAGHSCTSFFRNPASCSAATTSNTRISVIAMAEPYPSATFSEISDENSTN